MQAKISILFISFAVLVCGKDRPPTIQEALGGDAMIQRIASAEKMTLCLRPFEGDAEEQELSNKRESESVRLTSDEVKQVRIALCDPKDYDFLVVVDCWRYNYARLKVDDGVVVDFCPACGVTAVKKDGEYIGGSTFANGIVLLDRILFRSFPNDKILSAMKPHIERKQKKVESGNRD